MNSTEEEELEDGEIRQEPQVSVQPAAASSLPQALSKKQQKKLAKQGKQLGVQAGFFDIYGGENVRQAVNNSTSTFFHSLFHSSGPSKY